MALKFEITGDNSNLLSSLDGAREGVHRAAQDIEQSGMGIENMFRRIGEAAGIAFSLSQAKSFIGQVKNVREYFQDIESSMEVFLGSQEKAADFTKKLQDYAYYNMFEFSDLAAASKQMIAYHTNVEDIIPTLDKLSNIATGTKTNLMELVDMYNRARSLGGVGTQNIGGWATRGVLIKETLAEMGESVGKGGVTFEQLNKVIDKVTGEGGMFHDLMANQMQNISAEAGQLEDNLALMYNEIGTKYQDFITGFIRTESEAVDWLTENYEKVGQIILNLIAAYGAYRAALIAVSASQKAMQGFRFNTEDKLLQEEINKYRELIAVKEQARDADLAEAVAKGKLTKEQAKLIAEKRAELESVKGESMGMGGKVAIELDGNFDEQKKQAEELLRSVGELPEVQSEVASKYEDINEAFNRGEINKETAEMLTLHRDELTELNNKVAAYEEGLSKKQAEALADEERFNQQRQQFAEERDRHTQKLNEMVEEHQGKEQIVQLELDEMHSLEETTSAIQKKKEALLDYIRERQEAAADQAQENFGENGDVSNIEDITAAYEELAAVEEMEQVAKEANTAATNTSNAATEADNAAKRAGALAQEQATFARQKNTIATNANTSSENLSTAAKTRGRIATVLSTVADRASALAKTTLKFAIDRVTTSFRAMGSAFMANPIGFVITAVTTAISLFQWFNDEVDEAAEMSTRFGESVTKSTSELVGLRNVINALYAYYGGSDTGDEKTNAAAEKALKNSEEYKKAVEDGNKVTKEFGILLNAETDSLEELNRKIEEAIALIKEYSIQKQLANELDTAFQEYADGREEVKNSLIEEIDKEKQRAAAIIWTNTLTQEQIEKLAALKQARDEAARAAKEAQEEVFRYEMLREKGASFDSVAYVEALQKATEANRALTDTSAAYETAQQGVIGKMNELADRTEAVRGAFKGKNDEIKEAIDKEADLQNVVHDSTEAAREAAKVTSDLTDATVNWSNATESSKWVADMAAGSIDHLTTYANNLIAAWNQTARLDLKISVDDSDVPAEWKNLTVEEAKKLVAQYSAHANLHEQLKGGDIIVGGKRRSQQETTRYLAMALRNLENKTPKTTAQTTTPTTKPTKAKSSKSSGKSGKTAAELEAEREEIRRVYNEEMAELLNEMEQSAKRMAEDTDDLFDVTHNVIEQARRTYEDAVREANREMSDQLDTLDEDLDEQAKKLWEKERDLWVSGANGRKANQFADQWYGKDAEQVRDKYIDMLMYTMEGGVKVLTEYGKAYQAQMDAITDATQGKINRAQHNMTESVKKSFNDEIAAFSDYLKEYGNEYQKKLAIVMDYEHKIRQVREDASLTEGQREWQVKRLEGERDKNVSAADANRLLNGIDWNGVFSGFIGMAEEGLTDTIKRLVEFMGRDEFKQMELEDRQRIAGYLHELQSMLPGGSGTFRFDELRDKANAVSTAFRRLAEARDREAVASDKYKQAMDAYTAALEVKRVADSGDDEEAQATAAANVTKAFNALAEAGNNAQDATEGVTKAQDDYTNAARTAQEAFNDTIEGFKGISDGIQQFLSGNSMGAVMDGLVKLTQSLQKFDAEADGITGTLGRLGQWLEDKVGGFFARLLGGGGTVSKAKEAAEAAQRAKSATDSAREIASAADAAKKIKEEKKTEELLAGAFPGITPIVQDVEDLGSAIQEGGYTISEATVTASKYMAKTGKDVAEKTAKENADSVKELDGIMAMQVAGSMLEVLDILKDGIGTVVANLVSTVVEGLSGVIANSIKDLTMPFTDFKNSTIRTTLTSVGKGVQSVFDALTLGNFSKWFGIGGNKEEVQKVTERLTKVNEKLTERIESLTERIGDSAGFRAINTYRTALEAAKELQKNNMVILRAQMGYHSSHHSNAYYANDSTIASYNEKAQAAFRAAGVDAAMINGLSSIYNLSPEQLKAIRDFAPDLWYYLTTVGKYDKSEYWDAVVEQAGKTEALTEQIMQNLTRTSFDSLRDGFRSFLTDAEADSKDFAKNFEQMIYEALVNTYVLDDEFDDWLDNFYKRYGKVMEMQDEKTRLAELKRLEDEYLAKLDMYSTRSDMLRENLGLSGFDTFSQDATRQEYTGNFTQDSMDEFNGRMTTTNTLLTQILAESVARNASDEQSYALRVDGNRALQEIRSACLLQVSFLEDISKDIRAWRGENNAKLQSIADKLT